jgi:hypothetical protein
MWCRYCDKKYNKADWNAIAKFKQQKKAILKPNLDPKKIFCPSCLILEEINALKR